eukprot:TRINITY_DN12969_c0_g1_i1.p1 TRINITY_DN12969_c0_g1~~TRINITY_DN12969_c0_g1_i1.p1  ORF type:complete len:486 (-),score=43.06 TRINITY_DN12969_c0_g1_i1:108-1517(-)
MVLFARGLMHVWFLLCLMWCWTLQFVHPHKLERKRKLSRGFLESEPTEGERSGSNECSSMMQGYFEELKSSGVLMLARATGSSLMEGGDAMDRAAFWAHTAATIESFVLRNVNDGAQMKICQTGFNDGMSALAFLCGSRRSNVFSFESQNRTYTSLVNNLIALRYPNRHFLKIGERATTLQEPDMMRTGPCDFVFIEGANNPDVRAHINDLQPYVRSGTKILVSDCEGSSASASDAWKQAQAEGVLISLGDGTVETRGHKACLGYYLDPAMTKQRAGSLLSALTSYGAKEEKAAPTTEAPTSVKWPSLEDVLGYNRPHESPKEFTASAPLSIASLESVVAAPAAKVSFDAVPGSLVSQESVLAPAVQMSQLAPVALQPPSQVGQSPGIEAALSPIPLLGPQLSSDQTAKAVLSSSSFAEASPPPLAGVMPSAPVNALPADMASPALPVTAPSSSFAVPQPAVSGSLPVQ